MEFSSSECSDESCQLKIGQMLAAELIVVGNVGKVGSRLLVSAKMLETETARTHSAASGIYASLDEMVDARPGLAKALAGQPAEGAAATAQAGTSEKTPEATQAKPEAAAKTAPPAQPAKKANGKLIAGIAGLTAGVAAGGVGSWLIYSGATAGKVAVDAAQAAYRATAEADAGSKWDALVQATASMKTKLYVGIACAGTGVLLSGLGTVLILLPAEQPRPAASVSFGIVPQIGSALLSFRVAY